MWLLTILKLCCRLTQTSVGQLNNYFPQFRGKKSQVMPLYNMLKVAKQSSETPRLLLMLFLILLPACYILYASFHAIELFMEKRNTFLIPQS